MLLNKRIASLSINMLAFGEIMKWRALFIIFFLLGFSGCKISGPKTSTGPLANQTAILSAKAVPDIVAPGDTVQFICRITDSTNTKFRFYWYISKRNHLLVVKIQHTEA